ncbi:MAG TPA: SDR family oxidoreductase [bacterium]|nr:SDR family oxidoreductase [bacterium]
MNSKSVVLVTGANSGFGFACAKALAEKGLKVYATYRNPRKDGRLWELSRTLPLFPILMDVNRTPSVEKGVRQVLKREGRIDILLNNAGFVMAGFWEDLSDKDVRDQFETNVFGLLRVTRAVMPSMRKQGSGKILNVGSIAAVAAIPGLGAYSATKFAVNSITEALRMEARPWGVEVAEVNPGEIRTSVVQNTRMGERVLSEKSPYTPFTRQFEKFAKERFEKAAPVEKLVKVVLKALGPRPMKRRYLVKPDDYATYYLRWLLPDALWEWGLGKMFSWSRFPR